MLSFFSFFVALLCIVQCRASDEADGIQFVTHPPLTANQTEPLANCTLSLDGYEPSPSIGSAHKLHTWNTQWNNARRACYDEGGQLTILNSYYERDVVFRMMSRRGIESVWLGVHDLYERDDWTTVTGIPLAATGFTGWRPGEPNNAGGNERCVELTLAGHGGMNDINCWSHRSFVCEIQITVRN